MGVYKNRSFEEAEGPPCYIALYTYILFTIT